MEDTLAQALGSWAEIEGQPETSCREIMARRYTSAKNPDRYAVPLATEAGPTGEDDHLTVRMAQVLARLPRRQRTIVVLGSFHDEDHRQIAETLEIPHDTVVAERSRAADALHIGGFWPVDAPAPRGRREPERVTEDDLRRTLETLAHAELGPDAGDLVAGAERRARRAGRRRRTIWLGVTAALLTVGGAGLVFGDSPDDAASLVAPAVPDPDYPEGYGLVDGEPAPYTLDGLRLLHTVEVGPAGQWMARVPPTDPAGPVYAVAWCSGEEGGEDDDPSVTLWAQDRVDLRVTLPCHMLQDGPSVPVQAVPVAGELWSVVNPMTLETARVALYEEVPWSDFPFSTAAASEAPGHDVGAQAVLDAEAPVVQRPDLAEVAGTESTFSVTTPMTPDSELVLATSQDGPGQLLIAVDGVVVTNDNEALGPASTRDLVAAAPAVPDLRAGFRVNFTGDVAQSVLALDSDTLTDLGVDLSEGEVVVSAVPAGTAPGAWSVEISRNDYTPAARAVLPSVDSGEMLPGFAYGLRKAGEFTVPTDGRERQLDLEGGMATAVTWVVTCANQPSGSAEFLTVSGTLTGEDVLCAADDPWLVPLSTSVRVQSPESGLPRVAMATDGQAGTVRLGAYLPVAWEDYPFEDSTAAPQSPFAVAAGDTVSSGTDALTSVYVETDRASLADLDDQGRLVLQLEASQVTDLVVRTEGVGRFRLEGADAARGPVGFDDRRDMRTLEYRDLLERDGWWSSWTAEPSRWSIPAAGDERPVKQEGDQIVVTVEGYETGSLELSVLSLLPGER